VNFNDPSGHASAVPDGPGCYDQSCQIMATAVATLLFSPYNFLQPTTGLPTPGPKWMPPTAPPQPGIKSNEPRIGYDKGQASRQKILTELENFGASTDFGINLLDAIETVSNYGRPFYKQIKASIPGGGFIEGIMGSGLQYAKDLGDPNITSNLYFGRALITGAEDFGSDLVSSFFATFIAPAGGIAGMAVTGETGPVGSTVGGFIGGAATYLGTSYGVTRLMDERFWPQVNQNLFSYYFH
jgi:hypothetical protein